MEKPTTTTPEEQVAQEITRLCSDSSHSMPVLPPDDLPAKWFNYEQFITV